MAATTFTVDMDKKCVECGKGGATPSGLCLRCARNALDQKPMRSPAGRAVSERFKQMRRDRGI